MKLRSPHTLDLSALGGEPLQHRSFVSTYVDTPDRLLGRCGITLRRRLEHGRNDWQLKLPVERREARDRGGGAAERAADVDHGALADLPGPRRPGPARDAEDDARRRARPDRHGERRGHPRRRRRARRGARDEDVRRDRDRAGLGRRASAAEDRARRHPARSARGPTAARRSRRRWASRNRSRLAPKTDAERIRVYVAQRYFDLLAADPGVRLGADPEPVHHVRVADPPAACAAPRGRPDWWTPCGRSPPARSSTGWAARSVLSVTSTCSRRTCARRPPPWSRSTRRGLSSTFTALEADRAAARADALAALESDRYLALLRRNRLAAPARRVDGDARVARGGGAEEPSQDDAQARRRGDRRARAQGAHPREACALSSPRRSATNESSAVRRSSRTSSASTRTPWSPRNVCAPSPSASPSRPSSSGSWSSASGRAACARATTCRRRGRSSSRAAASAWT